MPRSGIVPTAQRDAARRIEILLTEDAQATAGARATHRSRQLFECLVATGAVRELAKYAAI
jgi:hypothetical protein